MTIRRTFRVSQLGMLLAAVMLLFGEVTFALLLAALSTILLAMLGIGIRQRYRALERQRWRRSPEAARQFLEDMGYSGDIDEALRQAGLAGEDRT